MLTPKLDSVLDDLVDVGIVLQAAIQKRMLKAITEGIKKFPEITAHREWNVIAEELKSLSDEEKAASLALLKKKLEELQNPALEEKALKGADVLLKAFKVIQQAVVVAKEAKQLAEEI